MLSFVSVAYQRPLLLRSLISCILAQSFKDFELLIIHDGPDGAESSEAVAKSFGDSRVRFHVTDHRFNDYGHSLREMSTAMCQGEFVGHTNDDNYYVPCYFERMMPPLLSNHADFVYCDMIHSHFNYAIFPTTPKQCAIDAGGWIARKSNLPEKWLDKGWCGDGYYVEQILKTGARPVKVPGVLFVHN